MALDPDMPASRTEVRTSSKINEKVLQRRKRVNNETNCTHGCFDSLLLQPNPKLRYSGVTRHDVEWITTVLKRVLSNALEINSRSH